MKSASEDKYENTTEFKSAKKLAVKEIKKAVKLKSIKTEDEARKIAKKYLFDYPSYEWTLAAHDGLTKDIEKVFNESSFIHPWFEGKVTRIVYQDVWGRVWNKSVGTIKDSTEIVALDLCIPRTWIEGLGGMSWEGVRGSKIFVCEYRTSLEEFQRAGAAPEKFIN